MAGGDVRFRLSLASWRSAQRLHVGPNPPPVYRVHDALSPSSTAKSPSLGPADPPPFLVSGCRQPRCPWSARVSFRSVDSRAPSAVATQTCHAGARADLATARARPRWGEPTGPRARVLPDAPTHRDANACNARRCSPCIAALLPNVVVCGFGRFRDHGVFGVVLSLHSLSRELLRVGRVPRQAAAPTCIKQVQGSTSHPPRRPTIFSEQFTW